MKKMAAYVFLTAFLVIIFGLAYYYISGPWNYNGLIDEPHGCYTYDAGTPIIGYIEFDVETAKLFYSSVTPTVYQYEVKSDSNNNSKYEIKLTMTDNDNVSNWVLYDVTENGTGFILDQIDSLNFYTHSHVECGYIGPVGYIETNVFTVV